MIRPWATATLPETREQVRLLPPHNVILENDPVHSMPFVMAVLQKVFGFDDAKAYRLMMAAHESGEAVIWTGAKEVGELKVEQVQGLHEIRVADKRDLGPVGVRLEPTE